MESLLDYEAFIRGKTRTVKPMGFEVDPESLNPRARDWQRHGVSWGLRRGRCAYFWSCGLGKTLAQLLYGEQCVLYANAPVLLLCPIGVRQQTLREAKKFGIGVPVIAVNDKSEVVKDAVNVTNYEKLHKFNTDVFGSVILDESQTLREFKSKTKRELCARFKNTPYRLACSATPAPNEYMELGCHAEFLGIMSGSEMLSRWFINDTMRAGEYRLLDHAKEDYWRWLCSWALALSRPSDMGEEYDDSPYVLPPIEYHYETVRFQRETPKGWLFPPEEAITVQTMHREKRQSCSTRAARAAEIVRGKPDVPWIVWADTDYEADALMKCLPEAIEVRGSHTEKKKEAGLSAFSVGLVKDIITKPEIGGLGLNWAHCADMVYIGLSYSFCNFYQSVRRCWRFGQTRPVNVWVIQGEAEECIARRVLEKQAAHEAMQSNLADAMRATQIDLLQGDLALARYRPAQLMEVPSWLRTHG